ncbi:MAG: GNAT family N-acetyltransferase [Oscillospiraceae bacterium]|nr:GNAT family N-acetyltransferase [Oscillospiraceae bacterium]
MIVRKFTPADYNAALLLWRETPGVVVRGCDDSEAVTVKFLERNPNTCFVAIENDKIIGTILGGNDGRRGYIYHLTVAESHRNRGIGKALADKTIAALRADGVPKISLFCLNENTGGNAFWERLGFTVMDEAVTWAKRFVE